MGLSDGFWIDIAQDVWGKEYGEVRCRECGAAERVNYAVCLSSGWPKCCGCTMTVDKADNEGGDR